MKIAFTICSNNYFAQAILAGNSFLQHHPDFTFYIGLVDKKSKDVVYEHSKIKVLPVEEIEPTIYELAAKYTIVELNTAVKPHYFLHFFSDKNISEAYYLDPDIYVYRQMNELSALLEEYDILLTPHILKPIPIDSKKPTEADFLNFGLYNLGFLALKKTANTIDMLKWWKERTYLFGYHDLSKGLFVDQLWMNLVPLLFIRTHILTDPGYNMGPWNLHERALCEKDGVLYVNYSHQLWFYHFSNFNPLKNFELHTVLDRFKMAARKDLIGIYQQYTEELIAGRFAEYKQIPCYYTEWRAEKLRERKRKEEENLPAGDKIIRRFKKSLPAGFRKKVIGWIQK